MDHWKAFIIGKHGTIGFEAHYHFKHLETSDSGNCENCAEVPGDSVDATICIDVSSDRCLRVIPQDGDFEKKNISRTVNSSHMSPIKKRQIFLTNEICNL